MLGARARRPARGDAGQPGAAVLGREIATFARRARPRCPGQADAGPTVQDLSVGGVGRASLDLVLPRSGSSLSGRTGDDVSVFDLVASRLGPEVAERLVEPLLGSIHAGSTRQLSAAATAPQLLAAAQANRSLITGLRQATKGRTSPPSANPLFVAPRLGMQSIADRLVERLLAAGTNFVSLTVANLRCEHRSVIVEPDGERFDGQYWHCRRRRLLACSGPCWIALRPRGWQPWSSPRWPSNTGI